MFAKIAQAADNTASTMLKTMQLFNPLFQAGAARKQDYYQRRQMSIQNQYQRELMAYQFDLNRQALDYSNEYNLPINQVRRLMEAGINPASLSGMGEGGAMASSSLGSSSIGSPGLPNMAYSSPGPANWAAWDVAQSQINLNNAKADNLKYQTDELMPVTANMYKSLTNKYDKDSALADAQTIYQNTINSIAERTEDEQVRGIKLRNDLTLEQINKTIQDTQKSFLESEDLRFKIENLNEIEYQQALQDLKHTQAMTCLAWAQKKLADANTEYSEQGLQNLVQEEINLRYQGDILDDEAKFRKDTHEFRVATEGWRARAAKREYRWLPWKNFSQVTGSIIGSIMSVYSKGKAGALNDSRTESNRKRLDDTGEYDFEEETWYDPDTHTRHRSYQGRHY